MLARTMLTMILTCGLLAVGCGDDETTTADSGATSDGGTKSDTGTTSDTGSTSDTGMANDTAVADSAVNPNACPAAGYAGCTAGTAQDETANNTFTIEFGGAAGFAYSPKCIKIKTGSKIIFQGTFGTHPLAQGCGPKDNVITDGSGGSTEVTFNDKGMFGYYCNNHGSSDGSGMAGAIIVE